MSDMRRREFIILLVATAAWPLASHAQPSEKIWRIGFLAHRYESFYDALFAGLRELGYVEGQNIIFERRYAEGRVERFKEFAAEMVRLKVDVIIVLRRPRLLLLGTQAPQSRLSTRLLLIPSGRGSSPAWLTQAAISQALRSSTPNSARSVLSYSGRWCLDYCDRRFSGMQPTPLTGSLGEIRKARLVR
jgi:hypothetical protein